MNISKIKILSLLILTTILIGGINIVKAQDYNYEEGALNSNQNSTIKPTDRMAPIPIKNQPQNIINTRATNVRDPLCQTIINSDGQKRIICKRPPEREDLDANEKPEIKPLPLPEPLEIKARMNDDMPRVNALLERAEIKNEGEIKSLEFKNSENRAIRAQTNEALKERFENFREAVKETRENLKEELDQNRENLRSEIEARGENGLEEILQDSNKRSMIIEMQQRQLEIRIMASFEKISLFGERLTDIARRMNERLGKMIETQMEVATAQNLLDETDNLINDLNTKVDNAINEINSSDNLSVEELRDLGKKHMDGIKETLNTIKLKLNNTLVEMKKVANQHQQNNSSSEE